MSNSKLKKITSARLFLPIVCLIAVLLINVIKTPDFFNITIRNGVLYGYVIDVINRASELVILAVGMTLVTAASGGQDISVGAVMAVAAAVCCQILSGGASSVTAYQNSLVLAVIAALLASALCGAFNGLLVAKLNIQPMVATLILYTAGRGIAQLVTNGQITYIRVESFQMAGGYIGKSPVPTPVLFAIVTVVIVAIILKKTALGLYIESVGINGKAARLVGLNSTMIKFLAVCRMPSRMSCLPEKRLFRISTPTVHVYIWMNFRELSRLFPETRSLLSVLQKPILLMFLRLRWKLPTEWCAEILSA